jgi:hypothetical protein
MTVILSRPRYSTLGLLISLDMNYPIAVGNLNAKLFLVLGCSVIHPHDSYTTGSQSARLLSPYGHVQQCTVD